MTRKEAQKYILENHGEGWLNLIDILFDNKPEDVEINEIFQKWAGLLVYYSGENKQFEELTDAIYILSKYMCEVCGKSAKVEVINDWEIALCKEHLQNYNQINFENLKQFFNK